MLGGDDGWSQFIKYSVDGCVVKHDENVLGLMSAIGLPIDMRRITVVTDWNKAKWSSAKLSYNYEIDGQLFSIKGVEGFSITRAFDSTSDITEEVIYWTDVLGGMGFFDTTIISFPISTSKERFEKAFMQLKTECPGKGIQPKY